MMENCLRGIRNRSESGDGQSRQQTEMAPAWRLGRCRNITWSLEYHHAWPFYPHRIADQLGIGVRQSIAFPLPSEYLFRTVFPWFFARHRTASARHPLRVSAGCRESTWMVQDYRRLRMRERAARGLKNGLSERHLYQSLPCATAQLSRSDWPVPA